jgi:hypothetical protein
MIRWLRKYAPHVTTLPPKRNRSRNTRLHFAHSPNVRGDFLGNPTFIYKSADPKAARSLSELERLAWVVDAIQTTTVLVPKRSHLMTPNGVIVENANFQGLSGTEARQLECYQLLRTPSLAITSAKVRREILFFSHFHIFSSYR